MFGGSKNTFGQATPAFSGFGQSAFAKPANTFGTNTFGQQNQTVFGAQPTNSGLFGSTPQAAAPQTGFGTFGQQTSIFGNTSTTGTTLFGSQQQQQQSSAFGAPKQMFGQPQQPTSSLFGQPQQPQQQTTSLFGQTTTNPGLFGATATPSSTSAFQPTNNQQNGTAIAKFQAQQETDQLLKGSTTSYIQTKQQCITFMKEYADKSLEELRIEDYAANRKGPQATSAGGGLFGTTNQGGFFGANQPSATSTSGFTGFGQQSTSAPIFGTAANTLGSGSSAFGANNSAFNQTSGGLFGKPLQTPAATTSSFGGFGTNTTNNTFGIAKPFNATATSTTTNLFGQPQQQTAGFGQPATNTFGASTFGQPQQQQPQSLFGASSTAPPAWNATSTAAQTGFNTNAGASLFGATAAKPAFGASTFGSTPNTFGTNQPPTSTGFNFGQTNTTGGSLFGQKPATNFFGQPAQQATSSVSFGSNSLFGSNNQTGGNLFGSAPAQNTTNTGGLFGSTAPNNFGTSNMGLSFGQQQPSLFNPSQPNVMQQAGTEIHQKILAMTSNPYGDNDLFKGLKHSSASDDALKATNPVAQKALLESSSNFKISPNASSSKIKIKPVSAVITKKSLFDGLEEHDASLDESFTIKTNAKRLIIKPRTTVDTNKTNDTLIKSSRDDTKITEKENNVPEIFQNQIPSSPYIDNNIADQDTDRRVSWLRTAPQNIRARPSLREASADTTMNQLIQPSANKDVEMFKEKLDSSTLNASILNETFHSNEDDTQNEADISVFTGSVDPHPTGIVLRRAGYYTIPSVDEIIEYMDDEGRCRIPNFTIGRRGYGNVYFDEEIDVAGLNLDEICHFRNKEIILYQDDDNKPPVGEGLNRRAQVTLDQIWPMDKTTHEAIKDPARLEAIGYEAKLRRICEKRKTKFLEYRPETGSCVFKVEHFSKYTLDDSDDESNEVEPRVDPKKARITPLAQNGKKTTSVETEKIVDENTFRMKQQDSTFILGPHLGQRGFQSTFTVNLDENFNSDPTSPSIKLAKEMQTDTHKLQLMKASFFVEDDTFSIMSDATEGRESPDQIVPSDFNQKSAFANVGLLSSSKQLKMYDDDTMTSAPDLHVAEIANEQPKRQELIQTEIFKAVGPKSQPLVVRPRVMLYDISDINLPITDSILNEMVAKRNNTVPFFNGRKFKISWSHGNEFTIVNSQMNKSLFKGRLHDDNTKSIIKLSQIKSMSHKTNDKFFKKSIVEHLKIQLKHDKKISVDSSDCKYFEANGGVIGLREHYELSQKLMREYPNNTNNFDATVWSLMESLWGYIDDANAIESQDHATVMLRRDLLSSWLENVVTDNEVTKSNQDYLDRLMNLMMCHKVADAAELAFENSDINLSLLLAQSGGSLAVRQLLQHQLSCWHQVEADDFIDERRLKVLMMVSGIQAMEGSGNSLLNIFENLNWLKCLALQLWYVSTSVSSVTDAILAYEQNSQNVNANVALPLPSYYKDAEKFKYYDIRFHLMKLYSQRSYSLEVLLNPANYSKDLMDYRLSFIVLQVLETLGYRHISESCRLKIYTSLSEQLETNGLWEWSIWIMLHISNASRRESAIQQLLYRYIRIDDELDSEYSAKEKFIHEDLLIPEKWIFWAKATRAKALNNHQVELKYLLKAQHWAEAHDVLMKYIAPDLFINDQIDYLKSLLKQFEATKEIQHWKIQGEILLNFIELNESFSSLNNAENMDADLFLQQLSPLLSELCSNIKLFPCPTAKHRLCQCEIAKQLAFIIRNFYATSNAYGNQAFSMIRTALEKLPLPQEYAQQELRYVLTTFLMERLNTN